MEKLNKLVELAKKATPGKWWIDSHGHSMVAFSGEAGDVEVVFATDNAMGPLVRHTDTGNLSHWRNDNDATFIAAANPTAILAIAEAFRALERTADTNMAAAQALRDEMYRERQRAEAAEAKEDELTTGILALIPDCRYMDPPDGGDVTPLEQLSRMVAELRSAPAVSLAELVPDEITQADAPELQEIASRAHSIGVRGAYAAFAIGANWMRERVLRKIEEAK